MVYSLEPLGTPQWLFSAVPSPLPAAQLSYYVVDNLMWLGMKDMINELRHRLRLRPIRVYHVPHYAIPYGYIWSPSLAPKPHGGALGSPDPQP
jgi:hypothetical protein